MRNEPTKQNPRSHGFTLIELMVAVVVVALLTTIALPSYLEHLAKARRAEGRNALLKGAQLQERFYSTFTPNPPAEPSLRYARTGVELATLFGAAGTVYSGEDPNAATGAYVITVSNPANCPTTSCFLLTATPNGRHAPDAPCGVLTLDSAGNRTESGTQSLDYCWGK